MRWRSLGTFLVGCSLAVIGPGCGGPEGSDDSGPGVDSGPDGDTVSCDGAADGTACGTGRVCVGGACTASTCGDGILDDRTEECDDGNETAFDGCDPPSCTFTCHADADCLDDDPCDGDETCGAETHICEPGTAQGDGSACSTDALTDGVCRASVCVMPGCGNSVVDGTEECDDGNTVAGDGCEIGCTYTCETDEECADDTVCNGMEVCDVGNHLCGPGTVLSCNDTNACTMDSCDPIDGCRNVLIDEDGDLFAPTSIGACGLDCDDTSFDINPDAQELCTTTIDEDCDGMNLPETAPFWFLDCDGDGYSSTTDNARGPLCDPPAALPGCLAWTTRAPTGSLSTDCDDSEASVNPLATEITGDTRDLDEDCNGEIQCFENLDSDAHRTDVVMISIDDDCTDPTEARVSRPAGDCADNDATIHPSATEAPGDAADHDENCDMVVTCFANADGDGFRVTTSVDSTDADCMDSGEAYASVASGDCDDASNTTYPGAAEVDGDPTDTDENCDGSVTCFANADNDSHRTSMVIDGGADDDCADPGEARASVPSGDCADTNAGAFPGATELAGDPSDVDEDCDGAVTCYVNTDGDTHRTDTIATSADADCTDMGEARASLPTGDCLDTNATVRPGGTEVIGDADDLDEDCSGGIVCYANADDDSHRTTTTVASADADCADSGEARASLPSGDCLDTNAAVNPGATESPGDAGDLDEDCNMAVACYANADGDGYRTTAVVTSTDAQCNDAGEAYAALPDGDCSDTSASVFPGATEVAGDATDVDENCDGTVTCFANVDNDSHRTTMVVDSADALCDDSGEAYASRPEGDCVDTNASVNPGAAEATGDPGNLDENCDGTVTCFANADGDSHRTTSVVNSTDADCADPGEAFASLPSGDCLDTDASVRPGGAEVTGDAGDLDENCDGTVTCFVNADNDTHRITSTVSSADAQCNDPGEAYASLASGDCLDTNASVHPGATEEAGDAGNLDENCDMVVTCFANADNDGYRTTSVVNSADGDCTDPGEALSTRAPGDCVDTNASVYPGATEAPGDSGNLDENCDGTLTCYANADGDTHRTSTVINSTDADCADAGEALASLPSGDCLDTNAAVRPGASEAAGDAGNLDENCDMVVTCYANADGDAYRTATIVNSMDADCADAGEAFISVAGGDCLDTNMSVYPGATEVVGDAGNLDENCDGTVTCYQNTDNDTYRTATVITSTDADCADSGEALSSLPVTDCNDTNASINPGVPEAAGDAGNLDENCDVAIACYIDADNDGWRLETSQASADADCDDLGEAYASDMQGDCNDADPLVSAGDPEVPGDAGNLDENCDGAILCYVDADNDGYRLATTVISTGSPNNCNGAGEAYASEMQGDCNDANANVSPGDPEVPGDTGDLDEDCNGTVACYVDGDDDGYRVTTTAASTDADCADPNEARVGDGLDCNDANANVSPGDPEVPGDASNVDENCDGTITCYANADGDTHRSTNVINSVDADCVDPGEALASVASVDCNDNNASVYPGASEVAGDSGNLDENCDGTITCYANADGDTYRSSSTVSSADMDCLDAGEALGSVMGVDCLDTNASVYPGASEAPGDSGNLDENCDGRITCYANADGDAYRTSTAIDSADADCIDPGEALASATAGDCNDADPLVSPGGAEVTGDPGDADENCDGLVTCYQNIDNDGYRRGNVIDSVDGTCNDSGEAYASLPSGDCRDQVASVNPGAAEVAGDATDYDENCDGTLTCYQNADGDAFRSSTVINSAAGDMDCTDPGEAYESMMGGDCVDTVASVFPGAAEVVGDATDYDENCDGIVTCYDNADNDGYRVNTISNSMDADCLDPGEAYSSIIGGDCNDGNAAISPGDPEVYGDATDVDENCDGFAGCYTDADNDGYRLTTTFTSTDADCADIAEGRAADGIDCNDTSAAISPGDPEIVGDAGDVDEDCSGFPSCYENLDGDAYRTTVVRVSTDADCLDAGEARSSVASGDCRDTVSSVYPLAPEVAGDATNYDENCDGVVTCYPNADADGYRTSTAINSTDADCSDAGEAYSSIAAGDCNDSNAAISPGDPEIYGDAGDVDENCDARAGCYTDGDDDGYRLTTTFTSSDADCADPYEARSSDGIDCNDANSAISPGDAEVYGNNVDENCDGRAGCHMDQDNDGARIVGTLLSLDADCADANEALSTDPLDCADTDPARHPGALELCNTIDEDCDGAARDGCPSATETLASPAYSAYHGGTTGTLFSSPCSAGQVLVGFDIWTNAYGPWVNGIRRVCRPVQIDEVSSSPEYNYNLNWETGSAETLGPIYGSAAGTMSSVRCSTNYEVSRIAGRSGALLDQISITCGDYRYNRSGSSWVSAVPVAVTYGPYGGTGGLAWGPDYCSPDAIGRGIRGYTTTCGSGTCIESISIGCSDLGYTPQ